MAFSDKETDSINSCFEEYESEAPLLERLDNILQYLDNSECDYDQAESYCISVLDSEFMNYPDGLLEKGLRDVLAKLKAHQV